MWRVDLLDIGWDGHAALLSQDELTSIELLCGNELQTHRRRSRGALRAILGRYLSTHGRAIEFQYGAWGKPAVSRPAFHFNLSHTDSIALIAIGETQVGVDIEAINVTEQSLPELVNLLCSQAEKDSLCRMPSGTRTLRFFQIWVRKEAYLKAIGLGLKGRPLHEIQVFAGADDVGKQAIIDTSIGMGAYYVHDINNFEGHVACICTSQARAIIRVHYAHPGDF